MIDTNQTLGTLATQQPAAIQVFLRRGLDFCCGGHRSLQEAAAEAGLDPSAVAVEIRETANLDANDDARWDQKPVEELVQHILVRYHEPLKADLPALVAAAQKVERVHGAKPECPTGLAAHLEAVHEDVMSHLAKEEQILFPAILRGAAGYQVRMPITVMFGEHESHGANLRRTRELAEDFEAPEVACATWRALYDGLAALEADLMAHIHLENNVLFPRVLNG